MVEVDRFGVRLETTDKKALRLVADIHVAVMGSQNGHASIDAVEGLGDKGVVFAGVKRSGNAGHSCNRARPEPTAQCDRVASDDAIIGLNAANPAVGESKPFHRCVLEDAHASGAGALNQRGANIGGTDAAVARRQNSTKEIVRVGDRPEPFDLRRVNLFDVDAKCARERCLSANMVHAVRIGRDAQAAATDPASRLSRLRFQRLVELGAVFHQGRKART